MYWKLLRRQLTLPRRKRFEAPDLVVSVEVSTFRQGGSGLALPYPAISIFEK
jgi:hypothetical protein